MAPFHYRPIGQKLFAELTETIQRGESVVLLGARYGGKRYTIDRLHALLQQSTAAPLVKLRLLTEPPLRNRRQLHELILAAVRQADPGSDPNLTAAEDILAPIDSLPEPERPILLASNVDGIAHHLARSFLQSVRNRVESKRLVAVLTGESNFRGLVHGPDSEFNCANQYVLQGFAEEEFAHFLSGYIGALHLRFEQPEQASHRLWERTGGSIYLLRLLLASVQESRARRSSAEDRPVSIDEIEAFSESTGIPGVYWVHVFRHAIQLIDRDPACWSDLEQLVAGKAVEVGLSSGPPGPLELAGLAVRRNRHLEFASPLMKDFINKRFDDLHFGDLHAWNSDWDKAFAHYRRLSADERLRPADIEDRADAEATISALCASLHSAAPDGAFSVMRLFAEGCRLILGFREVFFWQREKGWGLLDVEGYDPALPPPEDLKGILPSGEAPSPDWLPIPWPWSRCAAAMLLEAPRPGQRWAVTVSDLEGHTVVSHEREHLLRELFRHFRQAQEHAVEVEQDRVRLEVRDKHVDILNAIFDSLGRDVLDAGQVLAMAARGLRTLGYGRVLFCLVDPKRERIQGVLDDSDDPTTDVAKMTDWLLDEPLKDLQPYVIHTGKPKIVEDAGSEPLTNKEVVRAARMEKLAVVPLLNRTGLAVGTIHVERQDRTVPSVEEVEDLLVFGRQLAIAIAQSERVNLLQSGLDRIPEPVLIVDSLERCRYTNKPAAELFGLTIGWRDRSEAAPLSGLGTDKVRKYVQASLSDQRVFHHFTGIGRQPDFRGAALCDRIHDWRGKVVGSLLHIEDLNYLHRVLRAFQTVAGANDTPSAMAAMLEAAKLLGHEFGRLYLIDEHDPDRLLGKMSYGFRNPALQEKFNRGATDLPRRNEPAYETWKCIQDGRPVVFCWKPDCEDGAPLRTPEGLEAVAVRNPSRPEDLEKKPGQYWIDIPLLALHTPLGKLTVGCDPDLRPEQFEMLTVLSDMAAELLGDLLRRDRAAAERERLMHEASLHAAAEKSMSAIAHNILTQIGSFSPLLRLYREEEGKVPALKAVNHIFENALTQVDITAERTRKLIDLVAVKPEPFDLVAHLKAVTERALPGRDSVIRCETESFRINGDAHMLENAFLELIKNSTEMAPDATGLRVQISVRSLSRPAGEYVAITYEDNGPGVPTEFKESIFEDFFSYRPGGKASTGLGLSYVRRVIAAHRGTVRETGAPGQGARFVIEIPRFLQITEAKE